MPAKRTSESSVVLPGAKRQKIEWTSEKVDELFFWLWERIQRDGAENLKINYPAWTSRWDKAAILRIAREQCAAGFRNLDNGQIRDLASLEALPFDRLEKNGVWYCGILKDRAVPGWYKLYTGQPSNH